MPDRGNFWTPVPDWQQEARVAAGLHLRFGLPRQASIVSGDVGAFLSRRGLRPLGPRTSTDDETYALRLAPDRLLHVSADAQTIDHGWSGTGFAVSDMTDGIVFGDLSGARALELLQQGTSYDLAAVDERPNESCFIAFVGLHVAIATRCDGWRLHVERPHATALWTWFDSVMRRVEA